MYSKSAHHFFALNFLYYGHRVMCTKISTQQWYSSWYLVLLFWSFCIFAFLRLSWPTIFLWRIWLSIFLCSISLLVFLWNDSTGYASFLQYRLFLSKNFFVLFCPKVINFNRSFGSFRQRRVFITSIFVFLWQIWLTCGIFTIFLRDTKI